VNKIMKNKEKTLTLTLAENWNIIDTSQSVEKTFARMGKILDRLDKKS